MLKRSRIYHWTCSKFADFIRGEKKPFALEWGEWDKWRDNQKKIRPFRFWLSDTFLKQLQDIVYYPVDVLYTIRIYIRNRFIDKIQYLKTGLKPGEYYDLDDRMLHGLFNELVIFVESELAHLSKYKTDHNYKFKNGRCVEAGLDYLNWASALKYDEEYGIQKGEPNYGELTPQAQSSLKIKELYYWWKNIRPNRVDPYASYSDKTISRQDRIVFSAKLDEQYDQEDQDKLIELIKVRKSLWS